MKKLIFINVLFFTFFTSNISIGQNYSISGTILDSLNNKVIPFCNVSILKQADSSMIKGTTCDENGNFIFSKINQDSIIIRYSNIGFVTHFQPIILQNKETNVGKIYLSTHVSTLNGVEITATRPIYSFDADKKVYNVSDDISIQGGTTTDALQNAPGVWVDMEGNITLRGVSGVEIWINGKPSKIKEEGLKTYLQQLPANAIDRIEVMTNPSAKYGASGNGGIINIITKGKIKKNYLLSFGINGSTQPQISPWLSYVWSNEKWSISSYLSRSQSSYNWQSSSNGMVKDGSDTTYLFDNSNESNSAYSWNYGHLGIDYEFDKKSSLSFYVGGGISEGDSHSESTSNRYMIAENMAYNSTSASKGSNFGNNWNAGTTYTYKFNEEGKQFDADFSLGNWQNKYNSDFEQLYTIQTYKNKRQKQENFSKNEWSSLSFNFENPINDSTSFETGLSFEYSPSLQDNPIDTLNFGNETWSRAYRLYNKNHGYDMETEAFVTYSAKIWVIKYKLGARGEYKQYRFTSDALQKEVNRDFLNIYPSIFLSYQTKSMHNFNISYSRRVQYPEYQLDPFIYYNNEEQIHGGNPLLKEAFTNSFQAGWAKYFKSGGSVNISLYHRNTNNSISNINMVVFDTVFQRTTLFSSFANSGHDANTGGEFTITFRPLKNLNLMFTNNFYDKSIKADLGTYKIDKHDFSFDHRTTIVYTLMKLYTIQLMGYYRSANLTIQGSSDPIYYINATVRADLFKKRLSVRFGVQDIFNWQKEYKNTNTPTLVSSSSSKSITQYFTAGLTFRFGKIELESKAKSGGSQGGGAPM